MKVVARLEQLHMLNLGFTMVTDAGLKELLRLKHLKWLDLETTPVTDRGIAALKKDLANLEIHQYFK
jgi:hypothetical protein